MRILVTGLGGMAGGNVVKLMPKGSVVATTDANPSARNELARLGIAGVKFFTVPHADKRDAFKMAVNQIVIRYNIDLIIPTVDEELMALSYRPEHVNARIIVSPYETIRSCYDKARLYAATKQENFCPKFVVAKNRQDLAVFGNLPLFMKPRIGRGSRGVKRFENYMEVPKEDIIEKNVFCEFLPGQEYTVDCLFDLHGKAVVLVPRKRLKIHHGKSALGETIRHAEIEEKVKKLSSIFMFIGPANIQFKADTQGRMKLVEINPRFSGGLPITADAGANTPEMLYSILQGNTAACPDWKEGVFTNRLIQDSRIEDKGDRK